MNQRKSNLFKEVPVRSPKRSTFDLSHEVKMSGKFGFLYPVLCIDTLPGDMISDTMNCMVRFAPLQAPIMHRIDVSTHAFFVAGRLLTDHWEQYITGGQDGLADPLLPYVTPNSINDFDGGSAELMRKGSLWDYLGLPVLAPATASDSVEQISALPFRACAKIWNDYYRDPNLDTEMELDTDLQGNVSDQSINGGIMDIGLYRRAFEKDYFTSALPWAQRGAQVLMPLSGDAAITYLNETEIMEAATGLNPLTSAMTVNQAIEPGRIFANDQGGNPTQMRIENLDSVTFDNASTTINDLRRALAIQKWLENNARGGARYIEQIHSHFSVQVPDYRLQRAEYLGGGRQPVQISEVLSTAESGTKEVGDMLGHGLSVGRTNRWSYRCQEHGFVIMFLSVVMRTAYSQGIPKMFSRGNKYDHAWPELANLGEQEIKSKELFYSFDAADQAANQGVFGYTPRYAEYKFHNDRIAGDFRDNLGFWHLGRKFLSRPSLIPSFTTVYEDGDGNEEDFRRIFAVQDGTDYLWMQLYHHLKAVRPLPYFGVPSI